MKLGTPGFAGTALREAREARGITASSLSDLLGVTRSAVSQYELGIQSPRPEILERICSALNLPASHFLGRPQLEDFRIVFYRSMSADTKQARLRAERRLQWLRSMTEYLKGYVEMPSANLPHFAFPQDPKKITLRDIEQAAIETRELWGVGDAPIANLLRTVENNGVVVAYDDMGNDTMKAASAWAKAEGSYVLLSSHLVAASARYELARQIGHLVLHRQIVKQQLATNNDFALLKQQASRFGAALLLPESSFSADLYSLSLDAMRIVKQKWKTPIGVMIKRMTDLKSITADQATRLCIGKSRRGWKESTEPLDDELPIENPRLLSESVSLLIEEQVLSKSEILHDLPYSDRDLELLTGMPQGYITDTMPVISIIPPKQRRLELTRGTPAPLISFPAPAKSTPEVKYKKRKGGQ